MGFEFPFNLIGFFNRPITTRTQILEHDVGAKNEDFGAVLQTDLTRSLVPSVAQAMISLQAILGLGNNLYLRTI